MPSAENEAKPQDPNVLRDWHALYTRHQHEKSVAQALSTRGHDIFLPLVRVARRWQDRTKQLRLPLFPCYVFIRCGFDRQFQILGTPGLINIVAWAGRPAVIPEGQIDTVRQLIQSALPVEPHPFLQSGDRVRIVAGPLYGIEGILVREKNISRLVVSLEMLGRSAAVEIDTSCIETISTALAPVAKESHQNSASVF